MRFAWALLAGVGALGCRFDLPEAGDGGVEIPDAPPLIRTAGQLLMLCTGGSVGSPTCPINNMPLDDLGSGAGIPGARISFVVQAVGSGIYLTELRLVPGAAGAFIRHPLFVSIPSDPTQSPTPDRLDRFYNVTMSVNSMATPDQQLIGGGTAAFVDFPPANQLAVYFEAAGTL